MGNVLKCNRYRLVDNRSFELPLPMKYELYKEDKPVAEYEISTDQKVSFHIITKYKEEMLTPINRPLTIADIYFFLSSRAFQNNTPFTRTALSSIGLEKYNVLEIVKKTRGMTPYDKYWVKFEGDSCNYEKALDNFKELFTANAPVFPTTVPAPQPQEVKAPSASIADTEEILNQHKPDVSAIKEELNVPPVEAVPEIDEEPLRNNTMTADEIEALLAQSGLTDSPSIDHCDFDDNEPDSDTGKMSQDDIEKLIAAQTAATQPAPEPKADNGGKMSQDDIEKLIAAQIGAAEPVAEPAPEPKADGGKMSQDDIEKLIAAQMGGAEPAPEPKADGGKMSQDDIEKLIAAQTAATQPAPEPKADGGKMSQDDIEKLIAAQTAAVQPAPEPKADGGKMSQDDIEKLIAAQMGAAEPAPEPKADGGKMSQDDIEKLIAAQMGAAEPAPQPAPEPKADGGKMSQDEIEALLSGMKQDAAK